MQLLSAYEKSAKSSFVVIKTGVLPINIHLYSLLLVCITFFSVSVYIGEKDNHPPQNHDSSFCGYSDIQKQILLKVTYLISFLCTVPL